MRRGVARLVATAVLAFGTALCVALAGCSGRASSEPPRNVIIIVLDALRADRLGCYGHEEARSPTIDRLAAEGVLFQNAIAQCCFTPPAMASLLTGRHVPSHGLLGWEARLPDSEITLAEVLHDAGYRTAAFVFLNLLTRQGLGQGFDEGAEMVEPADSVFALARSWIEERVIDNLPMGTAGGAGAADASSAAAGGNGGGGDDDGDSDGGGKAPPFFLLLHCYDVHRPYTPPAPYDTMFGGGYAGTIDGTNETLAAIQEGRIAPTPEDHAHLADLYDGEVRYTDDRIGEFVRWLGERKLLDETLVVITADHGETLGERALLAISRGETLPLQYTHDESLYDPVMKIPLIVRAPRALPKGVRVARQVRQIDIMPTILALLAMEAPASVEGEALLEGGAPATDDGARDHAQSSSADSAHAAGPAFADAYPEPTRPNRYMRALRTPQAKLIHNIHEGTWQRYDLAADPAEERNLWTETGEVLDARVRADSLASQLFAHAAQAGEVEEICLVWEASGGGTSSGAFAGELTVSGGKILGVSQPPGQTDTEHEVSADGTRLAFGAQAGSRAEPGASGRAGTGAVASGAATGSVRKALWVRIDSARLAATLTARDSAGGALPIHIYLRGAFNEGEASFMPANVGHAYIDPFLEKTRGIHVFGRSRLEKQRIPISLEPEEIERLKALGYVGG